MDEDNEEFLCMMADFEGLGHNSVTTTHHSLWFHAGLLQCSTFPPTLVKYLLEA